MRRGPKDTAGITGNVPTVAEANERKSVCDGELADWRARREDVVARLTVAQGRAEALAMQVAAAILEGSDPKDVRKERDAVLTEVKELELAAGMAVERIKEVEIGVERAGRRLLTALALDRIDRLTEIAERFDTIWAPVLDGLAELTLAHRETAAILDRLIPNSHHEKGDLQLARALLWRLEGIVGVPRADQDERVPLRQFFLYQQARTKLALELTGE